MSRLNGKKFFGSFFQKRTDFLAFTQLYASVLTSTRTPGPIVELTATFCT